MKQIISTLAASLMIAGSACAQYAIHFPVMANTTGATEAYETRISFGYQLQENTAQRGSMQLSFSPANHFSIGLSYLAPSHSQRPRYHPDYPLIEDYQEGQHYEVLGAYYHRLGEYGRVEIAASYGRGSYRASGTWENGEVIDSFSITTIDHYSDFWDWLFGSGASSVTYDTIPMQYPKSIKCDYDATYQSFSIQPAIGVGNDYVSVTGGVKVSLQQYSLHMNNDEYNSRHGDMVSRFNSRSFLFYQPFVRFEAGSKWVKGYIPRGNISKQL